MYRKGKEYENLDKLAIDVYVDYGLSSFPLDEKELCKKMGIMLIPYSSYDGEQLQILKKKSLYGFWSMGNKGYTPMIFYNDNLNDLHSPATISQTIRHEIKHILCGDVDDASTKDDLAEHFGRYLACPTPYLIAKNITDINMAISTFGISAQMAGNALSAVTNRISKYGNKIFDYEKPLLNLFNLHEGGD